MMNRILVIACAAVLFAGPYVYATSTTTAAAHPAASHTVIGTIQKVDAANNTITVKVGRFTRNYHFSRATEFLSGGKHVKSALLKPGERVSIWTNMKNPNNLHKVDVLSQSALPKTASRG